MFDSSWLPFVLCGSCFIYVICIYLRILVFNTDVTCGAGTADPSGAPSSPSNFSRVRVDGSLVFCIALCRSLLGLLWWTVNSIPLCSLLDLKWQAFGLLWTVGVDIRIPVALRTLTTILVAGKKRSRPAVSDPDVMFFSRSEKVWSTGSWPIHKCTSSPEMLF